MGSGAAAFIAFLHCEANQAEARAKSLRATAAIIEANSINDNSSGAKKKRKRETCYNPTPRPKRAPTAYTLFVHENYEMIKRTQGTDSMGSREMIALVAQQWHQTSETEKQMWQYRADQLKTASSTTAQIEEENNSSTGEVLVEDGNINGGGKKRSRKS